MSKHAAANCWWLDLFETLNDSPSAIELLHRVSAIANHLGFSFVSYGMRSNDDCSPPTVTVLDTYPAAWMSHYEQCNYVSVDPTVRRGVVERGAIIWSDQLFAGASDLWTDAKDFGLRVGVAQSAWSSNQTFGLLSLARSCEPLTTEEIKQLQPRLRWLTETAHVRMHDLLAPQQLNQLDELSNSECDVLRWTTEGKTAWEIGNILSVSESTINFHLRSIFRKLGANNKVQAAAKAAALGILSYSTHCRFQRFTESPPKIRSVSSGIERMPCQRMWRPALENSRSS